MNQQKKTSPFRYAVGMFGTSIPINMFKQAPLNLFCCLPYGIPLPIQIPYWRGVGMDKKVHLMRTSRQLLIQNHTILITTSKRMHHTMTIGIA